MSQIQVSVTNGIYNESENFVSISYDAQPDNSEHDGDYEVLSGSDRGLANDFESLTRAEACLLAA